jgi:plasmid maintenance system antidote protein VapI
MKWRDETYIQYFGWKNLKEKRPPEHLCADTKIILERMLGWESVDWMHLAEDWDQWHAFMNMVMNLREIS